MIRIACTAILKRIVAGRSSRDGMSIIGGGEDVTSDVLKAVIDFIGVGESQVVTANGKPAFRIAVSTIEQTDDLQEVAK